ncbi:MAG: hypothetical protein NVSMB51_02410 [Solirubrobacteraceae bacterium]
MADAAPGPIMLSMTNSRFLLIPEPAAAEREPQQPVVRRYALARLDKSDQRGVRATYEYLTRSHD